MRKIIGGMFVSLDGVIQAPGGPTEDPTGGFANGGWMFPIADEKVGTVIGEFFSQPYDLLLGRRTYDIFAAYWPYADGEVMGKAFTAANKYVLTKVANRYYGQTAIGWAASMTLRGSSRAMALIC